MDLLKKAQEVVQMGEICAPNHMALRELKVGQSLRSRLCVS